MTNLFALLPNETILNIALQVPLTLYITYVTILVLRQNCH